MSWSQYVDAGIGVAEVSLDGRFMRANARLCSLLGYSEEELQELRVRDLTYPEDRGQSVAIVDRALHHFEEVQQVFKRYLRRDGSVLPALLTTTLKRDPKGEPTHFLSFIEDVEDRMREPLPQALLQRMQMLQEQERQRLARELHDELGQVMVALKMELSWLQAHVSGAASSRLERLSLLAESIVGSATRLQQGLRPPILDDLGLISALQWLLQETCGRAGIGHELEAPAQELALDSESRLALYRMAQEALSNILRHARAQHVTMRIYQRDQEVCLRISDDGVGFPFELAPPPGALGLALLRERVRLLDGSFSLNANPGGGTIIEVCLPIRRAVDESRRVPPHWE